MVKNYWFLLKNFINEGNLLKIFMVKNGYNQLVMGELPYIGNHIFPGKIFLYW